MFNDTLCNYDLKQSEYSVNKFIIKQLPKKKRGGRRRRRGFESKLY